MGKHGRSRSPSPSHSRKKCRSESHCSRSKSHSQSRSRSASSSSSSDDGVQEQINHLKADNTKIHQELANLKDKLNNEAHSCQRNLHFYGLSKELIEGRGADGLKKAILDLFTSGFKLDADVAKDLFSRLDTYHWTVDKALIIAFCHKQDKGFLLSKCKSLQNYIMNLLISLSPWEMI